MTTSTKYFDPETLSQLQSLSLRGRHLADGFMAGAHRSTAFGRSTEFSQHRQYTPGDDMRQVDWKVFARSDRYYVKLYENEANLHCILALDASRSMTYRGKEAFLSKFEYAQLALMTLACYLLDQRDAMTLATFSDSLHHYLGPSSQPSQWLDMIQALESLQPNPNTRLASLCENLVARTKRRSLIVLFSDFLDDPLELRRGLSLLKHERHDVILMQVIDRDEFEFPFRQTTTFLGLEQAQRFSIDPWSVRQRYLDEVQKHQACLKQIANQYAFDLNTLHTHQNLVDTFPPFIARRQRRGS